MVVDLFLEGSEMLTTPVYVRKHATLNEVKKVSLKVGPS